jgi:hypothetical protein
MLLHWNCNPSKARDEGDRFSMSADGSDMSIMNMLASRSIGVNSIDHYGGVLACGTDNQTITLFLGGH